MLGKSARHGAAPAKGVNDRVVQKVKARLRHLALRAGHGKSRLRPLQKLHNVLSPLKTVLRNEVIWCVAVLEDPASSAQWGQVSPSLSLSFSPPCPFSLFLSSPSPQPLLGLLP
jgi:hypothetical protein